MSVQIISYENLMAEHDITFEELVDVYSKGNLHPMDLKNAVTHYIDELVAPVRDHFQNNAHAKMLRDQVLSFQVTR